MTLENIVPSLEACKRIPEGEFKESALVWGNKYVWERREALNNEWHTSMIPAPTLAEILAELPTVGCIVRVCEVGGNVEYTASLPLSDIEETNTNPATAALRLWFRMKGIEVKA